MAFTVPTAVSRTLYDTAKRVRDEVGKGQEVLRTAKVNIPAVANASTVREVLLVPDVDIVVVGVKIISEGADADDLIELLALANGENRDSAAAAGNRLIAAQTGADASADDDILQDIALAGLNGNLVEAGQPIVASVQEVSSDTTPQVFFQVSYILADAVLTY